MQDAGRQGQPLLPAAGQRAGQLVLARRQLQPFQRAGRPGLLQPVEPVDAADELEVLANGEILVETEALGHVAGLALDRLAVVHEVVAEAGAAPAVGRQQAADHAQGRGLARAVRPEEAADAALFDGEAEAIDDGARAVALHQIMDVDRQCHGAALHEWLDGDRQARLPARRCPARFAGRASTRNTSLVRALWE